MNGWSTTEIGAVCLAVFAVSHWLGIFVRLRAVLAFIGVCLIGGGLIGHLVQRGATWVASLSNSAANFALHVSIGATIIAIVLAIVFLHDLHPKKTAGKRTSFVGIALAALMVAGVTGITAFNNVPGTVQHGVTNAKTVVRS